jgi:hypothetical protein
MQWNFRSLDPLLLPPDRCDFETRENQAPHLLETLAQDLSAIRPGTRPVAFPEHDALQLHGQLEPHLREG